ncbi:MAG: type I-C CRISPR-associated protein Cas8c/Csd1 [Prevotellaceae bacterium]|nr:type I-C CRISPR-associated protein Cas8c/Csd1 [Prevotellaceae bacterium]
MEDCRDKNGNGTNFVLPYGVHTNSITPFLFWDKCMYSVDYSKEKEPLNDIDRKDEVKVKQWEKSVKTAHEKHLAFIEQCEKVYTETNDEDFKAVVNFYKNNQLKLLHDDILWNQIEKNPDVNVTFRIEGATTVVASKPILISFLRKDTSEKGICLITGDKTDIVRKVTPTPILGCKASASFVSFQKNCGYDSYGKEQGYNAPISLKAEFAFSTVIKKIISKKSRNIFVIGSHKNKTARTFLFWASSNSEAAKKSEDSLFALFGRAEEDNDDPNRRIELVRRTFMSIYNREMLINKDDKFFILGLAPNSARIAVVYWNELPLREFAGLINKHFTDMEIVDTRKDKKPYVGLHSILGNVTLGGKSSDAAPNLPDAVVKSIFQGLPYPASLFQACIRRIRVEQSVNIVRAAIIKAYLNRLKDNNNNKKLDIMLDKENQNQGYLCGRLFAVLENLQYAANKQDTIRSSYMNAASATPSAVFSTILKLSNSHYSKLLKEKKWLANFFDNQKKEIIALIHDFPNTLDLNDQGRFFLGYYHQKNHREDKETEE